MIIEFKVFTIVIRTCSKLMLRRFFQPSKANDPTPVSLADACTVRDWALSILAPAQAEFEAQRQQLLTECDDLLHNTNKHLARHDLDEQARNPTYNMPDKTVSRN